MMPPVQMGPPSHPMSHRPPGGALPAAIGPPHPAGHMMGQPAPGGQPGAGPMQGMQGPGSSAPLGSDRGGGYQVPPPAQGYPQQQMPQQAQHPLPVQLGPQPVPQQQAPPPFSQPPPQQAQALPQSQVNMDLEQQKALLQQVMNLTPEQINSLPPDQRAQVLQLQQALR
eukprot:jgi/Mesen1/11017/ME000098S10404